MSAPSIDIAFSREVLRLTLEEVRAACPDINLRDAWVWKAGRDHWEFHYGEYYWHGSASNAYEARAKGWTAYLAKTADELLERAKAADEADADAQTIESFRKELGK